MKIIVTLSILVAAGIQLGCNNQPKQQEPEIIPVHTLRIKYGSTIKSFRYPATLAAETQSRLSFQVSGRISHIKTHQNSPHSRHKIDAGTIVSKGDKLARIVNTTYKQKLIQARGNAKAASLAKHNNHKSYLRSLKLYKSKSITQVQFNSAKTQYKISAARLLVAKAQQAEAEQLMHYTTLRAPYDGIIVTRDVDVGDQVSPAINAFTINSIDKLKAIINVPTQILPHISIGQMISIQAYQNDTTSSNARIMSISPEASLSSRLFRIVLHIENPDKKLRPGMVAKVVIPTKTSPSTALLIPIRAIVGTRQDDRGFSLYTIKHINNKPIAWRIPIQIGSIIGDKVAVVKGLNENDIIVVNGMSRLYHKAHISILQQRNADE